MGLGWVSENDHAGTCGRDVWNSLWHACPLNKKVCALYYIVLRTLPKNITRSDRSKMVNSALMMTSHCIYDLWLLTKISWFSTWYLILLLEKLAGGGQQVSFFIVESHAIFKPAQSLKSRFTLINNMAKPGESMTHGWDLIVGQFCRTLFNHHKLATASKCSLRTWCV